MPLRLANAVSSRKAPSALQFLDASKDGDFAGVLEHKRIGQYDKFLRET
jgi:hypothetical protein